MYNETYIIKLSELFFFVNKFFTQTLYNKIEENPMNKKIPPKNIFILFIIFFCLYLVALVSSGQTIDRNAIISEIKAREAATPGLKGIYVNGAGAIWFKEIGDGKFQLIEKIFPLQFTGIIKSPTDFELSAASIKVFEIEQFPALKSLEDIINFATANVKLSPRGFYLETNGVFGKILSKLASEISQNFSLSISKAGLSIAFEENKVDIVCRFKGTNTLFRDRKIARKLDLII